MTIEALFIELCLCNLYSCLCCCEPLRLVLLCFLCRGMWNPYLYVVDYELPLRILPLQSKLCCWTFRSGN